MSGILELRYGTWASPITSDLIAKMSVSIEDVVVDSVTSAISYIEKRPEEGGRNVILALADGFDIFGKDWNARTAVQEYGGAPAAVHNNIIQFSNFNDGMVYKVDVLRRTSPTLVVSKNSNYRFADFAFHSRVPNIVVSILENHTNPSPDCVSTSLVYFDTDAVDDPTILLSGADFYSSPHFNVDGTIFAWTEWAHPDMPWDGEQVFIAAVDVHGGRLSISADHMSRVRVAGQPSLVSAVQPMWLDVGMLVFSCDISGYHNPWVSRVDMTSATYKIDSTPIFNVPVELDFTDPSWWLGGSNYAILDDLNILFAASKDGQTALHIVSTNGCSAEITSPFVHVHRMRRVSHRKAVFLGSKVNEGPTLVLCEVEGAEAPFTLTYTTLTSKDAEAISSPIPDSLISIPVPISLRRPSSTSDHSESQLLHVVYYPPKNPAYQGLSGEHPPAVLNVHGGPTSLERQSLNLEKQFFTSRGWAWVDVNYSGSSNYGRKYMDRLKGNWGVFDVQDCVQTVLQLSSPDYALIDGKRVVIRGGSAGGYTTLAALCQSEVFLQVFVAGTSSYGVSDLHKLVESTHKFQSHYVQTLIGGDYEEIPEVYRARSPIFHAKNIRVPLLILQGSLDPIVPPDQAENMIKVIAEQGGHAEYTLFEGESHGWRKAETIAKALDLELHFYQRTLHLLA
ncbi:alpha/beta-hydrolase [Mycena rebaudengoi]|nr:alpha/beta-hydrolase [Mycena rebaudengoi]